MNQSLAIVGASTRSAAASAVRAGFRPLAADLFADADLRRIATATRIRPYPEGLLDWLRATEPPAWMYTGALENHPELVDQMAWIAPLLGNPGDVLTRVRSPWELADALRSAGLLFPETRASAEGLPQDGSWLVKTYRSASGSGVRELSGGRQVERENQTEPVTYQRRMDGTPCAAVYVAADGVAALLGITRQLIDEPWLGAHEFQYAGSIGLWPVSETARATLVKIGNVLAGEFELAGLFGVDFILADDEVWTLEVNPRYTASVEIVERCTGVSVVSDHVRACTGQSQVMERAGPSSAPTGGEDAPARLGRSFHGKAILFAKRDTVITQAFADYALARSLSTPWSSLADVSSAGTFIDKGRPILTLFADASTIEEVEHELRERVAEVEREIYVN